MITRCDHHRAEAPAAPRSSRDRGGGSRGGRSRWRRSRRAPSLITTMIIMIIVIMIIMIMIIIIILYNYSNDNDDNNNSVNNNNNNKNHNNNANKICREDHGQCHPCSGHAWSFLFASLKDRGSPLPTWTLQPTTVQNCCSLLSSAQSVGRKRAEIIEVKPVKIRLSWLPIEAFPPC